MVNFLNFYHPNKFLFWVDENKQNEIVTWLINEFGVNTFMSEWSFGLSPEKSHPVSKQLFEDIKQGKKEYCVTFSTEKSAMYFKLRWL
jgi:hypothetical protein